MQLGNGGKRDALGLPHSTKTGTIGMRVLFNIYEIMSEYFSSCDEAQCPLSSVTLGTLQDIGYNVEYSMTDTNYMPYLDLHSSQLANQSIFWFPKKITVFNVHSIKKSFYK